MTDLILPSNTARTDDLAALKTLAAGGTIGAMNYATGMGMPMYDPSRHTNMAAGVVPLDRGQQDRLMRSHKFIRKIIETIPNQMTYRWGDLTLGGDDGDPDTINEVHTWLDNLNTKSLVNRYQGLKRAFNQAMKMAFQTGNAALVILAKDGQNFDRPINTNNLKSIEGLFLADRWSIQPDISGVYANLEMAEYFWLNDSRFNKIIQLRGGDMGRIRIHRSRVLWFRGEELSDRTLLENEGCDDSVLQGVQQSFQEYFQAVRGAGRMIVDFDVVVHKVTGLLANIDNDPSGKYQQKMMERAQINNICRSIWRSMLIDLEDEDIVHSTRNVSGYDSLLDRLVLDLQANTDLTKAELFNEYSKGLSATDKVEQENANNRTRMYQESKLDSNMYDFLKLVFACKDGPTKGKEPDKWEWKWEELYPVTPVEQAELELMRSQIDQINSSIGAYTGEEAAKSHYSGSEYNPEITIDWKERDKLKIEQEKQQAEADKLAIQMGLLPGMEKPLIPGQPKQKALPGQQPGKALPGVTDSDDPSFVRMDKPCGNGFIADWKKCHKKPLGKDIANAVKVDARKVAEIANAIALLPPAGSTTAPESKRNGEPLTLDEIKDAFYKKFKVNSEEELKNTAFSMIVESYPGKSIEAWKREYRRLIGVLPDERFEAGPWAINGVDLRKYYRPWDVFGIDPHDVKYSVPKKLKGADKKAAQKSASALLEADVQKVFSMLAKKYHPDQGGDARMFNKIKKMRDGLVQQF